MEFFRILYVVKGWIRGPVYPRRRATLAPRFYNSAIPSLGTNLLEIGGASEPCLHASQRLSALDTRRIACLKRKTGCDAWPYLAVMHGGGTSCVTCVMTLLVLRVASESHRWCLCVVQWDTERSVLGVSLEFVGALQHFHARCCSIAVLM